MLGGCGSGDKEFGNTHTSVSPGHLEETAGHDGMYQQGQAQVASLETLKKMSNLQVLFYITVT